jgi:hypothetical protein
MKKFNPRNPRFRKLDLRDLDERSILLNLAITQMLTAGIGVLLIALQKNNSFVHLFNLNAGPMILAWGAGYALVVLAADFLVSKWVPEEVGDDGGVNDMIFGSRPLWQILILALAVSACEELLFRGAIQHAWGPYWTSILFAAIHVRYLRHWLMTGLVFGISYGIGWIYLQTGTLWTPIIAHFIIDFVMGCMIRYRRDS